MFSQKLFAVRSDLIIRPIRQGNQTCWVVKDPVAGKFFYFDEQEYTILSWLDGTSSVQTIVTRFCRRFAPAHLSVKQLSLFLSQLARAELLKGCPSPKRTGHDPTLSFRLARTISNPLAIRLPGINPSWLLNQLMPWCNGMFSPAARLLAALVMLAAFFCAVVQFDDIVSSLPLVQQWGTSQLLLTTAVVLVGSKVLHELAHAVTARRYGVRCESMGILLLIFTPCLYCDVSNAWLLPSRRARIAISMAGIMAELFLASVATLCWSISRDEPTRALLVTVMVVCSVSTLLFNGNPLLKYDGYFILSDLLGMPNLAGEAVTRWNRTLRGWIWGEHPAAVREETMGTQLILWTYGLLSAAFRIVLLSAILFGIFQYLDSHGLGLVGGALAVMIIATLLSKTAVTLLKPPAGFGETGVRERGCPVLAVGIFLLILGSIAFVPIPQRLDVPYRIESRESREVFLPVGGELLWAAAPGDSVHAGDRIAVLRNPLLEMELKKIDLQLSTLQTRLQTLDARRSLLRNVDERPALRESIIGLEQRRDVLLREARQLEILAPRDGIVSLPPAIPAPLSDTRTVQHWSGTPLDPQNRGCLLEQGTHLCTVTDAAESDAVLYVSQRRVQRVRSGQNVRLWVPGTPDGGPSGIVSEISPAPVEEIPKELLAKRVIPIDPASPPGTMLPQEPVYRVVAKIPASQSTLPLRGTGNAAIRVPAVTLLATVREWIVEAFDS